jgi:hypothetical protein
MPSEHLMLLQKYSRHLLHLFKKKKRLNQQRTSTPIKIQILSQAEPVKGNNAILDGKNYQPTNCRRQKIKF